MAGEGSAVGRAVGVAVGASVFVATPASYSFRVVVLVLLRFD